MKTAILVFLTIITFLTTISLSACAKLLEASVEVITPHESASYNRPPAPRITVSSLDEYREALLALIMAHEEATTVQYEGIESEDIQADILRIADEIVNSDPIAAYAVTDIAAVATKIVSHFEIDIEIAFKRTEAQLRAIVNASTQRYMMTQLLETMSGYKVEVVFLTGLQLEKEEIVRQVSEIYYQNPRRIVMMPVVAVEIFPEESENRIYEIKFGYTEDPEMLRLYGESLNLSVRQNAARAEGDTDGEILLSLVENLIASTVYDVGTAEAVATHGPQNIAATAYGALVGGRAVGEGFAAAFKALCDELRLDNRIVLGYMGDRVHAWNIVSLDGHYYHIDVAMCAEQGLMAGFLKTDDDFFEIYEWDTDSIPGCNGPLSLEDLLPQDGQEGIGGADGRGNLGNLENPSDGEANTGDNLTNPDDYPANSGNGQINPGDGTPDSGGNEGEED